MRKLVDSAVRMRRSAPAATASVPGEGNGSSRRGLFPAGRRAAQGDLIEHPSVSPASDLAPFLERQFRRQSQTIYSDALAMMERYILTQVLQHTHGNQSQAAKLLGITRGCLRSRIRAQRISVDTRIRCEDDQELSEIDTSTAVH
jgi:DNA-binding NtrC family response regulator